jgi:hypothetical protein
MMTKRKQSWTGTKEDTFFRCIHLCTTTKCGSFANIFIRMMCALLINYGLKTSAMWILSIFSSLLRGEQDDNEAIFAPSPFAIISFTHSMLSNYKHPRATIVVEFYVHFNTPEAHFGWIMEIAKITYLP